MTRDLRNLGRFDTAPTNRRDVDGMPDWANRTKEERKRIGKRLAEARRAKAVKIKLHEPPWEQGEE